MFATGALKTKYADMAQSVEHVLGKDGVGSSNLPISSKKGHRSVTFFVSARLRRTPSFKDVVVT